MARKLIQAAILYDFDGTLSPINMQEHEFIPKLGMNHKDFWAKTKQMAKENNACENSLLYAPNANRSSPFEHTSS